MTLDEAIVQARALSIDNQCGQHINQRGRNDYYTSDWYNSDSTVMTFDRGEITFDVTNRNKHNHQWWHAEYIHHHLVCIKCGLGWHSIPDMTAIDHSSGMSITAACSDMHIDHYDKCCEHDNRCHA